MRRIEKTVKIFKSFEEQEKADIEYWQNISGDERIMMAEEMRAEYIRLFYPEFKGIEKVDRIRKPGEE
jgi:hypothetical protein